MPERQARVLNGNSSSRPTSLKAFMTSGVLLVRRRSNPSAWARFHSSRMARMPLESMKSRPVRSTTIVCLGRCRLSTVSSCDVAMRSSSPVIVTKRSPPCWTLAISNDGGGIDLKIVELGVAQAEPARDQDGKVRAHRRVAAAAGYSVSLSRVRAGHAAFLHLMIWIEGRPRQAGGLEHG